MNTRSLTDKSILNSEPFLSLFYARKLQQQTRSQLEPWMKSMLKELKGNQTACRNAEAWIAVAFSDVPGRPRQNSSFSAKDRDFFVFLEFYWILFQFRERDAICYLNQQRKNRGLVYLVPVAPRDRGAATVAVASSTSDSSIKANVRVSVVVDALSTLTTSHVKSMHLPEGGMDPVAGTPINRSSNSTYLASPESPLSSLPSSVDGSPCGSPLIPSVSQLPPPRTGLTLRIPLKNNQTTSKAERTKTKGKHRAELPTATKKRGRPPKLVPNLVPTEARGTTKKRESHAMTESNSAHSVYAGDLADNSLSHRLARRQDGPIAKRRKISPEGTFALDNDTWFEDHGLLDNKSYTPSPLERDRAGMGRVRKPNFEAVNGALSNYSFPNQGMRTNNVASSSYKQMNSSPGSEPCRDDDMLIESFKSTPGRHRAIGDTFEQEYSSEDKFWVTVLGKTILRKPASRDHSARSQTLTSQSSQVDQVNTIKKPPLRRLPPLWSKSRQELCESFEWFRAYHSGVYHSGGYVKGYLLSAFASMRDVFQHDGRLIISHGGGKAECSQLKDGELVTMEAEDQSAQDLSVNALLATYNNCRPLVLLIDDKYASFPYDLTSLGVTYAVLGFFIITHAWAEYQMVKGSQDPVVRYKFAFQWCESQGDPWWLPSKDHENSSMPSKTSAIADTWESTSVAPQRPIPAKVAELSAAQRRPLKDSDLYTRCGGCKKRSPHIYVQGWACLNPKCPSFWKKDDGTLLPDDLEYTKRFLTLLQSPGINDKCPDLQQMGTLELLSDETCRFRRYCKGWHCRMCGRLSCRIKWECMECSNCGDTYMIDITILSPKMLNRRPKISFYQHLIASHSGIKYSEARPYDYGNGFGEFQTYILPGQRGFIHHIRGKNVANREADDIFAEYQQHAAEGSLSFQRWPLRTHKARGTLLANYFSQNSGQPYQYVGQAAHTVPMEATSSAVRNALKLIRDRISQALGIETNFNEVLTAAYFQRQKMAFHSDDEKGLGPMVAGLSLGSPALMHFRLNPKYATDNRERRVDITFLLCHGDVLVMDGAGVQEFYQHTVIPYDFRFAATARRIDP